MGFTRTGLSYEFQYPASVLEGIPVFFFFENKKDATPFCTPHQRAWCFPLLYTLNISFFGYRPPVSPFFSPMIGVVHLRVSFFVPRTTLWEVSVGFLIRRPVFFFFGPQRVGFLVLCIWNHLCVRFTPTCRCPQCIGGASVISHAPAACLFF